MDAITTSTSCLYNDIGVGLQLQSPVLEVANGSRPQIMIVAGVHGDELDVLGIITDLLDRVKKRPVPGTCKVVLAANPLAVLEGNREAAVDSHDLNRGFTDPTSTKYANALAEPLCRLAETCDLVITLHQYETTSPNMAAFYRIGAASTQRAQWAAIKSIAPEVVVWADPESQLGYVQYRTTIDAVLNAKGTPCVMLETSRRILEDPSRLSAISEGILRSWRALSGLEAPRDYVGHLVSTRHHLRTREYGIFEPDRSLPLLSPVTAGQHLGNHVRIPSFESVPVVAPVDGLLLQDRPPGFTRPTDYLAVIAEEFRSASILSQFENGQ